MTNSPPPFDPETGYRKGFHHRIYPHMDEMVQYAIERDREPSPWIVRDRSTALREERLGKGRAVVRTWIATDWYPVADDWDETTK